jgi:transcription elongation factor GreB
MPNEAGPNYITREGAKRLQAEIVDLRHRQRPKIVQEVSDAAAQGDRSENAEYIYGKRKLREIDRRVQWLTKRLESATVVEPRTASVEAAFFGAYVEVEDDRGGRVSYRIVGEDEIDLDKGYISWRSPLGRALLKKRTGDSVVFRRPKPDPKRMPPTAPRENADEAPEEADEAPEEADEAPEEADEAPEEADEAPEEADEAPEETELTVISVRYEGAKPIDG